MAAIISWLLPDPEFADNGHRFAGPDIDIDAPHRFDDAVKGLEPNLEIADRKDRRAVPRHRQRSFGSSASRRPSPMKLRAKSVEVRNKEGKISSQLAAGMLFLPWEISTPQLDIGSWTPSPK